MAELNYRSVLDGVADAVVAADESGAIVYVNEAAEKLLDWPAPELLGRRLGDLQPAGAHEAVTTYLRALTAASMRMSERLEVGHVAQTAVDALVAECDGVFAGVWLHDREADALELRASAGSAPPGGGDRIELATDPGRIAEAATSRQPLVCGAEASGAVATAAFPLLVGGELLGVLLHCSRRRLPVELAAALGAFAATLAALLDDARRLEAEGEAERATGRALARTRFLALAGSVLATSLDYETTLTSVARLAVPQIADWCRIDVVDESGELRLLAAAHADRAKERLAFEMDRRYPLDPASGPPSVVRTGEPQLFPELPAEMVEATAVDADHLALLRQLGLSGYLCVPLTARGRTVGALTCLMAESGRRLGEDDLQLAQQLARNAALAIDTARLFAEAQRTNSALERSNAELEEVAYIASHDLREPLRAIVGYAQLLQRRYQGRLDDDADTYIDFLVEGVMRMRALTDDLLDSSRAGHEQLEPGEVDLAELTRGVAEHLGGAIAESGARIQVGDLPAVRGDATQLSQVVQNLLHNALKFRDPARPLVVEVSAVPEPPDAWRVSVADNGIGIEPRHAERVFKMFQRLHTREEYPGTGIGLAICKRVVERHGGRIWCAPGQAGGTVFHFTLPDASTPPGA